MACVHTELRGLAVFRKKLRDFFDAKSFLEVQTPVLVKTPGVEKHLQYFQTWWEHPRYGSHKLYLRSSPEIAHKYLLTQGIDAIYEIGPCMRQGEEIGPWHNPEFTMLEFYKTNWQYEDFLVFCTKLVDTCIPHTSEKKWHRIAMAEAFEKFAGFELRDKDPMLAAKAVAAGVISVKVDDCFEDAFFKTLIEKVEPGIAKLGKVVLERYPASQAALSKKIVVGDQSHAARFELFLDGVELGNCFLEEEEADKIQERVEEVKRFRDEGRSDDHILASLCNRGIPQSCGAAFGVERLYAASLKKKNIKTDLGLDRFWLDQSQPSI